MSVAGISSTNVFQPDYAQTNFKKVKSDFAQVGQDLQSGNLSQAQADFATLQKDLPQGQQTSSTSTVGQDFNNLAQALQSGNLSQAQQAFSTTQNDLQSAGQAHHHHHHGGGGGHNSAISQDFTQLSQALQSGDLTSAQSAFSTLQNDLQQYKNNSGSFAQNGTSALSASATAAATSAATSAINSTLSVIG
jgi:hypothetical protein